MVQDKRSSTNEPDLSPRQRDRRGALLSRKVEWLLSGSGESLHARGALWHLGYLGRVPKLTPRLLLPNITKQKPTEPQDARVSPRGGTARTRWKAEGRGERHILHHDPPSSSPPARVTRPKLAPTSRRRESWQQGAQLCPIQIQQFVSSHAPNQMLETKTPGAALISAYAILLARRKCLSQSPAISSWLIPWSGTF